MVSFENGPLNQILKVQSGEPDNYFASKEIFNLLINSAEDYAVFVIDIDGRIMTWDMRAERIKGYHASEISGKHISVFYSPEYIQKKEPMRNLQFALLQRAEEKIVLLIKDNGIGFEMKGSINKKTWGLPAMKERATMMGGKLTIDSERQKGRTVEVKIPISSSTKQFRHDTYFDCR
jgi:PAS domain S-box-containing protein